MSLLLLIDGYNVVAPVAAPGRTPDPAWLQRERNLLLQRLVKHLAADVRFRTCVVFDAANPPPDRPSEFEVDGVSVRFALDYPEADDLLEELIAAHSAPKNLAVVSSDQRIQVAAKRRGCQPFDSQRWLDDLMRGHVRLAVASKDGAGQGGEPNSDKPDTVDDVQQWMRDFGF
jgi:predicted RNA-binding protein with PIN domain